jgi:hypothetical protein
LRPEKRIIGSQGSDLMPNVFKKNITRCLDAAERQVKKGTPSARKVRQKSTK